MLLLTGEYELSLDDKNRLSIPSKVREQIDEEVYGRGFYVVLGVNRILSLYPEKYYERIALAVAPRTVAPDESLAFERVNFALAGRVELDRQGRVLLSDKSIRRAGIKERVTLIGSRDHLELWDRHQWEHYVEEVIGRKFTFSGRVIEVYQNQKVEIKDENCQNLFSVLNLFGIPEEDLVSIQKDQTLRGEGTIRDVNFVYGNNIDVNVDYFQN